MGSQTGADSAGSRTGAGSAGSRTGAGSGTASWPTASSWMASRSCWTEEAFLLLRRERGSRITASGGSTASWVASGGAAAASAVSGGTSASLAVSCFFSRLWGCSCSVVGCLSGRYSRPILPPPPFTGHRRAGASTNCRWKGGTVGGVGLRLGWGFKLPTMVCTYI